MCGSKCVGVQLLICHISFEAGVKTVCKGKEGGSGQLSYPAAIMAKSEYKTGELTLGLMLHSI